MIVPSDKDDCYNICKNEIYEDSENNILFKIRIIKFCQNIMNVLIK